MPGAHTELAFEVFIAHHLVTHGGWTNGDPKAFDRKLALTPDDLIAFIQATRPGTWEPLHKQHGVPAAFTLDRADVREPGAPR